MRLVGAAYDTSQVREGEARLGRVLESMSSAFYQLDAEWRFTYVNSEAERLLGAGREQLVGESIWEAFPAAVGSDFEVNYRDAVATGRPVSFEAYYPPPLDGWYEVRAWPSPEGLAVYFVDITDRREAQDALARSARRLALLAVGLRRPHQHAGPGRGREPALHPPRPRRGGLVPGHAGRRPPRRRLAPRAPRRRLGRTPTPRCSETVQQYSALRLRAMTDESYLARTIREMTSILMESDATDQGRRRARARSAARDRLRELDPESAVAVSLRGARHGPWAW